MGWTAGLRFTAATGDFRLLHSVQISSGTHAAFYPMGTGGALSLEVKRLSCEASHLSPTGKSKNM
jgi:hypothetical protein